MKSYPLKFDTVVNGQKGGCTCRSVRCWDICSRARHHCVPAPNKKKKNSEVETGSNKNRIHHVLSTSEVLEDGKETCLSASCGLARAICYF